jgi:hypothetical protein
MLFDTAHHFAPGAQHMAVKLGPKGQAKVSQVMHEYKQGDLHSGSATGPKVTDRKQAIAIGLNQGRQTSRAGPRKP